MASDTRLLPQKTPRSTGIAQTQMVNRPATMGTGGLTPPVTASPAAAAAIRAQAAGASAMAPRPTRAQDARVDLRDTRARTRGSVLPGPPGSAVASVELLPNVTGTRGGAVPEMPPAARGVTIAPAFMPDELLLLMHLTDKHMSGEISDADRELAEGAQQTIRKLLEQA